MTAHVKGSKRRIMGRIRVVSGGVTGQIAGLDPEFPQLRVATPADCVIDCLLDIWADRERWWVPLTGGGLSLHMIRSVQVVDAAVRWADVSRAELKRSARGRFCRRRLQRIWRHVRHGADSIYETATRLCLQVGFPKCELQYCHFDGNRLVTISDLCWPMYKVAVFYDGRHHNNPQVYDLDTAKVNFLQSQGWTVIRLQKGDLRDYRRLRAYVMQMLERGGFRC